MNDPRQFFAHRLALAAGRVNVDDMLEEIEEGQFRKWMAFDRICPFGHRAENEQMALFASTVAALRGISLPPEHFKNNTVSGKEWANGPKTASADAQVSHQTVEEQIAQIQLIAAAHNASISAGVT